ncbi:LuxR C-terminal-related transcriptional regulator [Methylobacterium organophilum]|uniref:Transcriptional regulatory protein LiaR n=1 Tax=Methylobacterium organophilum TaxID=410 RepID=A0ABQ4TCA4_METOR|nr:response regulator transcription factor [Methylobacterium organophilum]UMY18746.1 response regulator transcription factor [Methylobacterium organophilum]GJE29307.1 Transcriptional regulatory protein LiaR [Methylobacterium organophilum]
MSHAVEVLIVDEPSRLDPNARAVLEHAPSLRTIGEADLDRLDPTRRTIALVVLRETHLDAHCERIARLRAGRPGLEVLVAFHALHRDELQRLIRAGAAGFVARSAPPAEICAAILALASDDGALVAPPAPASHSGATSDTHDGLGLTPREAEVLRFLSAGFSNKEVARRLSLSVRTVETHRLNLRRKTQTGRLKDLVSLARQLRLDPVLDADMPRRILRDERPARH